jgi:hypothetical protein
MVTRCSHASEHKRHYGQSQSQRKNDCAGNERRPACNHFIEQRKSSAGSQAGE